MKSTLCSLLLAAGGARAALDVDLTNADSIKAAAKKVAANLMTYYKGNQPGQTPGILPGPPPAGPYYWWEGGAMWGTLVDYWHYTGDETYNNDTTTSLLFQASAPQNSYMPPNWTASLGNDDQGFWGMSAMRAAEANYPNPPKDQPQWLALAQAVFNTQAPRWDTAACGGGLHWQIPIANKGYDYKNSIANGIFFNLGARLARYTTNETYANLASQTWDWMEKIGFINSEYDIYDGARIEDNCQTIDKAQFSYNAAAVTQGVAFMWNYTQENNASNSEVWRTRLNGLVNRTISFFFQDGILVEVPCELQDQLLCNTDELSFKGYMHRWLADVSQLADFTAEPILAALKSSTKAAVNSCQDDGTCGFRWNTGGYDGNTGAGQEMSVLGALSSLLVTMENVRGPLTNATGGTSQGDPNAGVDVDPFTIFAPITAGDKAGAAILTAVLLVAMVSTLLWMASGLSEHTTRGIRTWRRRPVSSGMFGDGQVYEKPPEQPHSPFMR